VSGDVPIRPGDGEIERAVESVSPKKDDAPIARARVVTSPGKRILRGVFASSLVELGSYVLFDVLLPEIKDLIATTATSAVDRAIYGDRAGNRPPVGGRVVPIRRREGWTERTNYTSFSTPSRAAQEQQAPSSERPSYKDLEYSSREDAGAVLRYLIDAISEYGTVTLGDLYDKSGVSVKPVDQRWGWRDLSFAGVRRSRGGFVIDLPQPEFLR
jgi:hypothetical protein